MAVSSKHKAITAQRLAAIHADNARYHRERFVETGRSGHLDAYHEEARKALTCSRSARFNMYGYNYYAPETV